MIVDVRVRVCCATGVITAGEEVVDLEVDEVVDGVVDEVEDEDDLVEVGVLVDEVFLDVVDVSELDDADVLSFGDGVGLGKRKDRMPNCLSWNSIKCKKNKR